MTKINDGGPAFPTSHSPGFPNEMIGGLSIRDYFAAKAMHQLLHGAVLPVGYDCSEDLAIASRRAYEVADAMLKARSEGGEV